MNPWDETPEHLLDVGTHVQGPADQLVPDDVHHHRELFDELTRARA